jgi:pyruvate kinase
VIRLSPNSAVTNNIARTKIVATLGPASNTEEMLAHLIREGVDVFRLNMAHGGREQHIEAVGNIRRVAKQLDVSIGILVDLAGPKIRLGKLAADPLVIENGQTISFVPGAESNSTSELVCLYEPLIREVNVGDAIVLADGIARVEVTEKSADRLTCRVIDGGKIRTRQGVNLPSTNLSIPALGEVDIDNARWAAGIGADFVSLSFVRNADEVHQLRAILRENHSSAMLISKIEKREALDQLDSIVEASDGVMVARGDLGVEIAIEKTPMAQKKIIETCFKFRKPVIVATQMLESMHTTVQPTRAEVSDVANAILDGADACMLSGETAIGEYPVEAVRMMNNIMLEVEGAYTHGLPRPIDAELDLQSPISQAIVHAAADVANRIRAKLVVIASSDYTIAAAKSKQRNFVPTICLTNCGEIAQQMSLLWGVTPVVIPKDFEKRKLLALVHQLATQHCHAKTGDSIVTVTDTDLIEGTHDTVLVSLIQ